MSNIKCEECEQVIDIDFIMNDMDMDDNVTCQVCRGSHFECEDCGTICAKADHAGDEVCDNCQEIRDEDEEADREDEED